MVPGFLSIKYDNTINREHIYSLRERFKMNKCECESLQLINNGLLPVVCHIKKYRVNMNQYNYDLR